MPYIKSTDGRREALQKGDTAKNAGELNYQIFYYIKHHQDSTDIQLIEEYVKNFVGENPNYQKYNDMTGALIRCAIEIERRLNIHADLLFTIAITYDKQIAKYEDLKIIENGDVE